jgi:hypothetical protein
MRKGRGAPAEGAAALPAGVEDGLTKCGQEPNGIKLVVTYYHIKGYGRACRVHPCTVETGPW